MAKHGSSVPHPRDALWRLHAAKRMTVGGREARQIANQFTDRCIMRSSQSIDSIQIKFNALVAFGQLVC
jgi:hypothetical protein